MSRRKRLKVGDIVGMRDTHIQTRRPYIDPGWTITETGRTFHTIQKEGRTLQLRRNDLVATRARPPNVNTGVMGFKRVLESLSVSKIEARERDLRKRGFETKTTRQVIHGRPTPEGGFKRSRGGISPWPNVPGMEQRTLIRLYASALPRGEVQTYTPVVVKKLK